MMQYKVPFIKDEDLNEERVRDEVQTCVKYVMSDVMPVFGENMPEPKLEAYVNTTLRKAFQGCGANYDKPTRNGLLGAIENCKMGVEKMAADLPNDLKQRVNEIVQFHYVEMKSLIERLHE